MAASVFWTVLTVIALLLGLLINPFFLVAAVVFIVVGLFSGALLRKAADTSIGSPDPAPSGTATTSEASYDPSGGNTR